MPPFLDVLVPIGLILLMIWLITRISYTISDKHVRVVLLGLTLRKIVLSDIESVDTRSPFWNEHWCNTLWACGRVVRIRRRSGIMRNFIITPVNCDEFIFELRGRLAGGQGKAAGGST
jgi:hypothetical protein